MSYLKNFRAEASERLDMVLEAPDNSARRGDFLDWLAEKILESYRNCQKKSQTTDSRPTYQSQNRR